MVRFFDGAVRPLGGWRRLADGTSQDFPPLAGVPRAAIAWRTDTQVIQVFATTDKLYAILGGEMHDITPVGYAPGLRDSGFVSDVGKYSSGPYGSGNYGQGSQTAEQVLAATWQLSPFGDYLASVSTSDGKLRVWQGDPGVLPTTPTGAPANAIGVVSTPERFLFVLGADGAVRRVRWASQETIDQWDETDPTLTAGFFDLVTNGRLMCGRASKDLTLLWTDTDVHAATYIGQPLLYRFSRVGENCGVIGANAVAMLDGQALWMSRSGFFIYDGYVRQIPCEIRDHVFDDLNYLQAQKIWAVVNSAFGEVWFFYPSAGSTEIDRYAVYNYQEKHWTPGRLARGAGYDAGAVSAPVWVDMNGVIYEHDTLSSKQTIVPWLLDGTVNVDGSQVLDGEHTRVQEVPVLESGPIEPGNGDRVIFVQRIVPDVTPVEDVHITLLGSMSPTAAETEYGPYPLSEEKDVRLTARHLRLRLEEVNQDDWRIGSVKLGIIAGSRR